jgi:hypothetical protein
MNVSGRHGFVSGVVGVKADRIMARARAERDGVNTPLVAAASCPKLGVGSQASA